MKILFTFFIFISISIKANSQKIGIFAGYCNNHYYDLAEESPYFISSYNPGDGYTFGICIDRLKLIDKLRSDTIKIKLNLKITKYSGHLKIFEASRANGKKLDLYSEKFVLGLDFRPINVKIYKELVFSFGGEISYLIAHKEEGSQQTWTNTSNTIIALEDTSLKFNKPLNFGVNLGLDYNIELGNQYYIVPSFIFYLGLTNEFLDMGATIWSYRHNFNLGIAKRL